MPTNGSHLPDFSAADGLDDPIIDWGFGSTPVPTTPAPVSIVEPSDAPATVDPGPVTVGERVQAVIVYDPSTCVVRARAWAELANGYLATATLQHGSCTLDIHDETGLLGSATGRIDPIDGQHVRFSYGEIILEAKVGYVAVITLETAAGTTIGPRAFDIATE